MFTPKPRYRFYGSPTNYMTAARHVVTDALGGSDESFVAMLEDRVEQMVDVAHAICVPQARFGIYLALARMIEPGQRVLLSPYTIYDVVNMVISAGGVPVFCDIDRETCNIDPRTVQSALEAHRGQVGAVMITHLHGLACDVTAIAEMCAAHDVPLMEDAAQAFGAMVGGRRLGGIGDVGIYSFGRAKNINGFYGGMVVTGSDELARGIRADLAELPLEDGKKLAKRIAHCLVGDLMTFPPLFSPVTFRIFKLGALRGVEAVNKLVQTESDPQYRPEVPEAYFRRMTPMQARVIYDQLFTVDDQTVVRTDYARAYHAGLVDLVGARGLRLPPMHEDGSHIYLQYPIQIEDRWDFVRHMMRNGRDVAIQHMGSAADMEIFSEFHSECPNARQTADECVILPTYPSYGMREVEANIAVMRDYFSS